MVVRTETSSRDFRAVVRDNQVLLFVILAFAFSWWAWVWYRVNPDIGAPIHACGPLIAALIVLALAGGWPAVRKWLGKIVLWRVGWRWYALVLLLPLVLTLTAYAICRALGAEIKPDYTMPGAGKLAFQFVFILLYIGLGEEPGWRGFLLPRLLDGRSALVAAMIVGAVHTVWHLPLFGVEYDFSNVLPWALSVFCYSIVITFVYLHTGGSLLMPMLLHASNNTVAAVIWRRFEGADSVMLWWIWMALWVMVAGALVVRYGTSLRRTPA